jgi:hypothetical protein
MNQPQLPSPGGGDRTQDSAEDAYTREDSRSQQGQPKRTRIPDTEEILTMLLQLNGLVTLGMIFPAQANVLLFAQGNDLKHALVEGMILRNELSAPSSAPHAGSRDAAGG